MILTDDSPMPFGKYKGKKMANVPARYLIYLYDEGLPDGDIRDYIDENLDVLNEEIRIEEEEKLNNKY